MERIQAKILKNSDQLQEECEAIQILLGNILEKNQDAIRNGKDALPNKNYLLNMIEFQYNTIQKLLQIGIELDEFIKQIHIPNIDNFSNITSCKSELSSSGTPVPCRTISPCNNLQSMLKPSCSNNHSNICPFPSNVESVVILDDCANEIVGTSNLSADKLEKCLARSDSVPQESQEVISENNFNDMISSVSQVSAEVITENLQTIDVDVIEREEINKNDSDSSTESNIGQDKAGSVSSADMSSFEDVKKTVQDKLKSKKLMTRRDRYLQNIQRPSIDIAFRPSNKTFDSNDNYVTCPDSSSSPSTSKMKERKRRKRKSNEIKYVNIPETDVKSYRESPDPFVNLVCFVSHAVTPSEFYINHCNDNVALIDSLSAQLAEIYTGTNSPYFDKKTAMENLGSQCICFVDRYGAWYRVDVINWRLRAKGYLEDLVTIFLVDYGHTCNVSYKNLRELSPEFCHIPKCAIKCHLAWLYPPGSTKENLLDIWPKDALEYFFEFFKSYNECYKVVYVEKCGDSWGIDLIPNDEPSSSETFGQRLIDNKFAVEIYQNPTATFQDNGFLKQIKTAQGLAGISQNMKSEDKLEKFHDNTAEREYEYNTIDQAMLRYTATDEARICKNMRPDGTCFKGKKCKMEHHKLRPDGYTTDKQCTYIQAFRQLEMPAIGSKIKLKITNVVNVNTFYACLFNANSGADLNQLIKLMNNKETVSKYKCLEIIPTRGELVIAKSWNKSWYRAQVKDLYHYPQNTHETVQVFLVDLGETVDLKMSELRIMTSDFLHVPFQAIYCRLYNVKPKENQDLHEAKSYFETNFLCEILDAEVMHVSPSTLVVALKTADGEDAGEQIIDDGFGELRSAHEYPAETILVD